MRAKLRHFLFELRIRLVYRGLSSRHPHRTGRTGERLAELYLRKLGWRILGKRVRFPVGEIDLIASRHGVLVFVEVKTRRYRSRREVGESLANRQRRRVEEAARLYLTQSPWQEVPWRIDALEIIFSDESQYPRFHWIRHWGQGSLEGEPTTDDSA